MSLHLLWILVWTSSLFFFLLCSHCCINFLSVELSSFLWGEVDIETKRVLKHATHALYHWTLSLDPSSVFKFYWFEITISLITFSTNIFFKVYKKFCSQLEFSIWKSSLQFIFLSLYAIFHFIGIILEELPGD